MLGVILLSIGLINLHLPYITTENADNRNDGKSNKEKELMKTIFES